MAFTFDIWTHVDVIHFPNRDPVLLYVCEIEFLETKTSNGLSTLEIVCVRYTLASIYMRTEIPGTFFSSFYSKRQYKILCSLSGKREESESNILNVVEYEKFLQYFHFKHKCVWIKCLNHSTLLHSNIFSQKYYTFTRQVHFKENARSQIDVFLTSFFEVVWINRGLSYLFYFSFLYLLVFLHTKLYRLHILKDNFQSSTLLFHKIPHVKLKIYVEQVSYRTYKRRMTKVWKF